MQTAPASFWVCSVLQALLENEPVMCSPASVVTSKVPLKALPSTAVMTSLPPEAKPEAVEPQLASNDCTAPSAERPVLGALASLVE